MRRADGIEIEGKCFKRRTKLTLFANPSERAVVLYGKNGSGKSTIAEAFRAIQSGQESPVDVDEQSELTVQLIPHQSDNEGTIRNQQLRVSVFDEHFIDEQVKLRECGVGSVVLIGDQGDAQADIEAATQSIRELEKNKEVLAEKIADSEKASKRLKGSLKDKLSPWADRDREIKGNKVRTRIDESRIDKAVNDAINLTSSPDMAEVSSQWEEARNSLDVSRTKKGAPINLPILDYVPVDLKRVKEYLEAEPDVASKSEVATRLQESLRASSSVKDALSILVQNALDCCPVCQQSVSAEQRAELHQALLQLSSETRISDAPNIQEARFDQDAWRLVSSNLSTNEINDAVNQYNYCLQIVSNALSKKKENPFNSSAEGILELKDAAHNLEKYVRSVEDERKQHNDSAIDESQAKKAATLANERLTICETKELALQYHDSRETTNQLNGKNVDNERLLQEKKRRLDEANARMRNTRIAVEEINRDLRTMLFSGERLQLKVVNRDGIDYYVPVVRGRQIGVMELSTGERNLLALAYFFTRIREGESQSHTSFESDEIHVPRLIIVDDPISSFDKENRVGISLFLTSKLIDFLEMPTGTRKKNSKIFESRCVVMTHDSVVWQALISTFKPLSPYYQSGGGGRSVRGVELRHNESGAEIIDCESMVEYGRLLRAVYEYALDEGPQRSSSGTISEDLVIGNITRRLLEAYVSLVYNNDLVNFMSSKQVKSLGDGRYSELIVRLGLHDASHTEDATKSLMYLSSGGPSHEDLVKICRTVLCLLYQIEPEHLKGWWPQIRRDKQQRSIEESVKAWLAER